MPRTSSAVRIALAAVALAAAPAPWLAHRGWQDAQERLAGVLVAHAAALPPLFAAEVRREPDPMRGQLALARALLAAELDPRTAAAPRPEGLARLAMARELAAAGVAARPAAWDAAMVLGGATYLGWAQTNDPRLLTAYRRWEDPLLAALALGPGKREPPRLLAAAYLELWPVVAAGKRALARRLLADGFRDPATFERLIGPWLEAEPNRAAAFALVPAEPRAWEHLQGLLAGRADWAGASAAHARWRRMLRVRLEADLRQGEERLHGGDPHGARQLLLGVAAHAEPGPGGADLLARALAVCPPGPTDSGTAAHLAEQLAWVLDRCQVASCPLSDGALRRLAGFCRDLPPEVEALAAAVAGDLDQGELAERRAAAQWSELWAPYLIAKARLLARRGRPGEAAEALAAVHRDWQVRPLWWQARREVAQAASDPVAVADATRALDRQAAAEWPATAWTWERGRARLALMAAVQAAGLGIAVDDGPAGGAWVELRLDGGVAGRFAAVPGAEITLAAALGPGLHLLDLRSVAGGTVYPGRVRLVRATGPRRRPTPPVPSLR